MKTGEEEQILEAIKYIKCNSPKLHLYFCGKLLEKAERGTHRIKQIEARRSLGSILHISRNAQQKILDELELYKLLLRLNRKEYLIPITYQEYEELFSTPLKKL